MWGITDRHHLCAANAGRSGPAARTCPQIKEHRRTLRSTGVLAVSIGSTLLIAHAIPNLSTYCPDVTLSVIVTIVAARRCGGPSINTNGWLNSTIASACDGEKSEDALREGGHGSHFPSPLLANSAPIPK